MMWRIRRGGFRAGGMKLRWLILMLRYRGRCVVDFEGGEVGICRIVRAVGGGFRGKYRDLDSVLDEDGDECQWGEREVGDLIDLS